MPIQPKQQPPYYSPITQPATKIYICKLTQTGTDNPIATEIINTYNEPIVWTRDSLGRYFATSNNQFTTNKTVVTPSGIDSLIIQPISDAAPLDKAYAFYWDNENICTLKTYQTSDMSLIEFSSIGINGLILSITTYK